MTGEPPLHVRMRATEFVVMLVFDVMLLVIGLAVAVEEMWGLAVAVVGGVDGLGSYFGIRRMRADVTIGELIHYRRGKLAFDIHPTRITRVRVGRTSRRLTTPTIYYLTVRHQGRHRELPFAKHWFDGDAALRCAERVAARIGVPVFDPLQEKYGAARFPPLRWFARGKEWKLALLAVPVLGALIGVFALFY